MRVLMENLV
jgi:hypothetical protein